MALFAAYADVKDDSTATNSSDVGWLTNSSFKIDVTPFQTSELQIHPKHFQDTDDNSLSETEDNEVPHNKQKRKHKKSKKSSKKQKYKEKCKEFDGYSIDKKSASELKYVNTIARPSAPKYKIYKYIALPRERKVKKFKRYYQVIIDKHVNESASEEELTAEALNSTPSKNRKKGSDMTIVEEQEISRQTGTFNRKLQIDAYDIDTWIKYINFQDNIFNFEKYFKKGSIAKGLRVTAERKLTILDRALQHNPDCELLLRMRVDIAAGVFPADELQTQLKKLVDRDSGNIILWQAYIEASQCSMSHCTAPTVINLYIKCLHTLHTIRRTAKLKRVVLEESILRMLYQCGLFLRQAGLFEQLWTLLRMYLELNLSGSSDIQFGTASTTREETLLVELEDTVLKSQLPIHELWPRIEKLREACHYLPVSAQEQKCADPQRLVFTEDVSELIHPITMPGNTFRLTVMILTLLKIPLLPCRHVTMKEFGIDYVPWSLDSIETLLPMFYPLFPLEISNKLLCNAQKLVVGPQYLKTLPGQEEYLQFILTVMTACGKCLAGREKLAITVWWFRFLRLLTILEKLDMFKVTMSFKKKLRTEMKSCLRENSTNIVLFKEYALVETENNFDSGINVLKTALDMNSDSELFQMAEEKRTAIVSTLRTFIELHLFRGKQIDKETKQVCFKYICAVVTGKFTFANAPRFITQSIINETKEKFAEVNVNLLRNDFNASLNGVDYFLPDFTSDWLILNASFLFLNDFGEARIFIENILNKFEDNPAQEEEKGAESKVVTPSFRTELLYEFLVAILFKTCTDIPGAGMYPTLDKYIQLGLTKYPNNMFLLATLAEMQTFHSNYGQPWWKIQKLLLKSGHALSTLFSVLIANQQINDIESNWVDTITGRVISVDNTFKNRILNLFKRLTRSDMCTRRCGLVWRLYLQFLHAYFDPKVCRDAYYLAVEECPWLKSLYIDAAVYIPEDLALIQDLLIEKQLRIHVTPEELDVLRS